MELNSANLVQMYCANCGAKVIGFKGEDGGVRISCKRCMVRIFSKQKNRREINIKLSL